MPGLPRHAISLACCVLAATPAMAEPEVIQTETAYDVAGSSVEEIRAAMTANSPESYWGYTRWYVSWTAQCEVTVKITYTYPNWTDYEGAEEELQDYWDTFIANLRIHERGHANHGLQAGFEIEETGCVEDPYGIIETWGSQDTLYDDETKHGETQGAVF